MPATTPNRKTGRKPQATSTRRSVVLAVASATLVFSSCSAPSDETATLRSEVIEQPNELAFEILEEDGVDNPPELPPEQVPELLEPEQQLAESELDTEAIEIAVAAPDVEVLDVAGLTDDGPTAEEIEAFGDGHTRNSTGELVILDEPASLACADSQIALLRLDEGDLAAGAAHVVSAAERAASSELAEIRAWSDHLSASIDDSGNVNFPVLVEFLSVCVDGGYAL